MAVRPDAEEEEVEDGQARGVGGAGQHAGRQGHQPGSVVVSCGLDGQARREREDVVGGDAGFAEECGVHALGCGGWWGGVGRGVRDKGWGGDGVRD